MAMLKDKVNKDEEREFSLDSNVFLRPPLKQIGDSIFEIKQYFTSDVGLKIVPSSFISPLKTIKEDLFKCVSENRFLPSVDLITGDKLFNISKEGFVFLAESLALAMDFPVSQRHEYVQCDTFIALPHQPVLVLTLVDGGEETREARLYNSSVARGVTKSLRRFMNESVNVVFGTLLLTDLKDVMLFEKKVKLHAERCSLAVTEKSLSMAPKKYNKTLVAFWAAVSEMKSFAHGTGNYDNDYIRFLTKDQCLVLVENINCREVSVTSEPGCGGTTLMFEVAKRLSRLGKTLLMCRSVEEKDRLKPLSSVISVTKEPSKTEMCAFEHIVDGIGTMECQIRGRLWHFKGSKEIIHETATMKTPQVGVMALSEETKHLLDKVNDLEQTMITGNGLSQTAKEMIHETATMKTVGVMALSEETKHILDKVNDLEQTMITGNGLSQTAKEMIHETATMKTPQVGVMALSEETKHLLDKVNDLEQTMITGNGLSQTAKEMIHETATMKTPQVGVMALSEETKHLLDKVNDLEQTIITGNGLSQTDLFSVQHVINRLLMLEKHKSNREKLITLLTSVGRQRRVNHLIQELKTLKLIDSFINLHTNLPLMAATFNEKSHKKSHSALENMDTEGKQHNEMFEQLQKGLHKCGDLFPVLKTAIQEDIKSIFYIQAKIDYLLQEMSVEGGIGFWEPTHDKRQSEFNERVSCEANLVMENHKQLVRDQSAGQVKQSAVEAVSSRNIISSLVEDFEAKANITALDLKSIQQMKESLEEIKQEIDSQNEDLSKHSTEDRSEWESKLELLSKEIPGLCIHRLITDVIGDEVIMELAKQSQTPDILTDPTTNANHQRGGRGNRVHQLRQFQFGKLTNRHILDILDDVIRDNMETLFYCKEKATHLERVYGSPVYIITEYGSSRSSLLSCRVMKLDKSRVNTDWCHVSTDGGTLVNKGGEHNVYSFREYWGTCSSPPIPLPPSPSTLTAPRYWESHTRLSVGRVSVHMWPNFLEMGICGVREVDRGHLVSEQTRSSWALRVVGCRMHSPRYCTQVRGEGRRVGRCYNTMYITPDTQVVYRFGVVVDVDRGRVAFLDLDRDIVIEKMNVRITQPLRAMFGVEPSSHYDVQMRLVSGGEIAMTDNKQSLIYKALSV